MARKTNIIQIQGDEANRDRGKIFHLTELPATQAERWAMRALQALLRSNVELPDDVEQLGMAAIARLGFKALGNVDEFTFLSLMDEMMTCVSIQPDPGNPEVVRRLVDNDIEEVATRIKLRMEVFSLHTGFSMAGAGSTQTPSAAEAEPASSSTATSPRRLAR